MGWLITHIMGLIGAASGWINPFVGLMVYYWFSILRPPYLWFWAFDPATAPRFSLYIGVSVLIGWAIAGFGSFQGLRGTRLAIIGLVVYFLSGVFSWQMYAVWPLYSELMLDNQFKIVIMVLVTMTIVRDARSILTFTWVVIASLGYLAWVLNDWYFINPNYLHNNGFGSIDNNGTAMIMVAAIPLSFFMAVYDGRLWVRLGAFFATACQVHVILFSYSRGSQLGLCMVGGFIFLFSLLYMPRKFLTLGAAAIFVALTLYLAGDGVRQRFMSIFAEDRDASAESRFHTWSAAWNCIKEHPLGVGPRNFGFYAPSYGLTGGKAVHNLYLQTGADYGVIGMLGMITFYGMTFINTILMARTRVASMLVWPKYLGLAVSTSIGGFLLCSMFIGMESVEIGYIICTVGLATVAYVNRVIDASPGGFAMDIPELVNVPSPLDGSDELVNRFPPGRLQPSFG